MIRSQIEVTPEIKAFAEASDPLKTSDDILRLRGRIFSSLVFREWNESTREEEMNIRWKRTAAEILKDGYVYKTKACTDIVVLFIALCGAKDLTTRFVKIKKGGKIHSVAEVRLPDGWYVFDVSTENAAPYKGEITEETPFEDWTLWKKGRDAWDIGLTDGRVTDLINSAK